MTDMAEPYYRDEQVTLLLGDALEQLRTLPDDSIDCIVTSPPYYGLRSYGVNGQYGLEASPAEYVATMCAVFAEARRVLANDGTLWLNLGDSYSAAPSGPVGRNSTHRVGAEDAETQDAPPVEPHPTEADLRHALTVAAKFHGQKTDGQSERVHGCPPDCSGLTPCCGRTPFELPLTDRISSEAPVTCPGPAAVPAVGRTDEEAT